MLEPDRTKDYNAFLDISCVENEIKLHYMNLNFGRGDIKDKLINVALGEKHLRQALFDTIILDSELLREFNKRANLHSNITTSRSITNVL
jgi:hypothetical protein